MFSESMDMIRRMDMMRPPKDDRSPQRRQAERAAPRSRSAVAPWPRAAAMSAAVWPSSVSAAGSAPWASRSSTAGRFPRDAAMWSGRYPPPPRAFASAPRATSSSTVGMWAEMASVAWSAVFAIHFLSYLPRVLRSLRDDWRSARRHQVAGSELRLVLLAASLGCGLALALVLLPLVTGFHGGDGEFH